jgi:hypothetical protein
MNSTLVRFLTSSTLLVRFCLIDSLSCCSICTPRRCDVQCSRFSRDACDRLTWPVWLWLLVSPAMHTLTSAAQLCSPTAEQTGVFSLSAARLGALSLLRTDPAVG